MANNRLYIVDTSTNEYLCIAKGNGSSWNVGNIDLYAEFMRNGYSDDETMFIIGTENDTEFFNKWIEYAVSFGSINYYSFGIAVLALFTIMIFPKFTHKIPGSIVALIITTLLVELFHLPVETIGSKFGELPSALPLLFFLK